MSSEKAGGCLEFFGGHSSANIHMFELGEEIERTRGAIVRKCKDRQTGENLTIKIVDLNGYAHTQLLIRDTHMTSQLQHPSIVRILHSFVDQEHFCIVMECVGGGDLGSKIEHHGFLSELSARNTIRSIGTALAYAHSKGISHRNLELQSILCVPHSDEVKLADFNFSGTINRDTLTGSHSFVAPEVLEGQDLCGTARCACDLWSLGIITYVLLCGYPPFYEDDLGALFAAVHSGKFEFVPEHWADKTKASQDLISRLLIVDPHRRITAQQLLEHPWIKEDSLSNDHMQDAFEHFKKFLNKRRFHTVHNGILAVNRMQYLRLHRTGIDSKDS
eukprot:c4282_g1_i1.p1 GENE.c4282_g1_i1~~c4282_g1_i1.p1  ORF type:complete len:358 (+),score=67.93 c4282_g1_i1:81-1076(+)